MSIIRGRVYHDREIVQLRATFGGKWPFIECECGKWIDPKTGEHVQTMTMSEFLERYHEKKPPCPDKKRDTEILATDANKP